jgi:hypothetical protein
MDELYRAFLPGQIAVTGIGRRVLLFLNGFVSCRHLHCDLSRSSPVCETVWTSQETSKRLMPLPENGDTLGMFRSGTLRNALNIHNQRMPNLRKHWSLLNSPVSANGSVQFINEPMSGNRGFYRIEVQPSS